MKDPIEDLQIFCACNPEDRELEGNQENGYYCINCEKPYDYPDPMDFEPEYSDETYEFYQEQ